MLNVNVLVAEIWIVTLPALVPPTAGATWQEKQLFELNAGPRPMICSVLPVTLFTAVPCTLATSSKIGMASNHKVVNAPPPVATLPAPAAGGCGPPAGAGG
jgi:hypothetical protein